MSELQIDLFLPPLEMSTIRMVDPQTKADITIEVIDVLMAVDDCKKKASDLGDSANWMDFLIAQLSKTKGIQISKTTAAMLIGIAQKKWVEVKNFSSPEQQDSASGDSQSQTTQE